MSADISALVGFMTLSIGFIAYGVILILTAKAINEAQRTYYEYLKERAKYTRSIVELYKHAPPEIIVAHNQDKHNENIERG